MVSAILPKAEHSTKVTSSRSSPCGVRQRRLTASPNSTTGVWLGRYRSCGSRVRLPISRTLLKLAIGPAFQSESRCRLKACTTNESLFASAHLGFVASRGAIAVGAALEVAGARDAVVHADGRTVPAGTLFAHLDGLGFDGFHFVDVEMIGLEHQHAQDFFAELHIALDGGDGRAGRREKADDVGASLLAADFIGQFALIPLLDHHDLSAVALDDAAAGFDAFFGLGRGRRAEEEHRFV